jgi:hypothetical protein
MQAAWGWDFRMTTMRTTTDVLLIMEAKDNFHCSPRFGLMDTYSPFFVGRSTSIIVLVAKGSACGAKYIPDLDRWPYAVHTDCCVQRQGIPGFIFSINRAGSYSIGVLPDSEVAIDECVVEPENWVAR